MKIICFPFYHGLLQIKVNLTKKLSQTMHRKDLNIKNKVSKSILIQSHTVHKQLRQTCPIL
jgi:hypothetical protein